MEFTQDLNLRKIILVTGLVLTFAVTPKVQAQGPEKSSNASEKQTQFKSEADQEVSADSILLFPCFDNVEGVYAKPVFNEIQNKFAQYPQFKIQSGNSAKIKNPEDFFDDAANTAKFMKDSNVDAMLTCKLTKGPNGITLKYALFTGKSGQPLLIEESEPTQSFATADILNISDRLLGNLRKRMPYKGLIQSRKGQQVTIGIGSDWNIKEGDELEVIQILKVNRHPKFKTMVGLEKTILGKLKVFKVDDHLSFASITFEKEAGVLRVGNKLQPLGGVNYAPTILDADQRVAQDLSERPDRKVSIGDMPTEWLPEREPQYGKISLFGGLGQYSQNLNLTTQGGVSATNSMIPLLRMQAELWINPEWIVFFDTQQSVFTVTNPVSGSTPSSINVSTSRYDLGASYNMLFDDQFFGTKIFVLGGLSQFTTTPDGSSPVALTGMTFGGLYIGAGGYIPMPDNSPFGIGAKFKFHPFPTVSETGGNSGSSSGVKIMQFGFSLDYKWTQRSRVSGYLDWDYYSADFTGSGTRADPAKNIGHKVMSLGIGAELMF